MNDVSPESNVNSGRILVGLGYARSGMACKKGLAPANKVGVIDS